MRLNNPLSRPIHGHLHGLFTDMLRYPHETILFYDTDMSETKELAHKGHDLNSLVLGPQYQLQADGSTVNIGATMPVDTINGEKWLRSCGAVTNLFGGDTSQARAVSLTSGTVYTLHVFGAGTVSCSYGTATVASPLKITATDTAAVPFTPSGATSWMLTATAYPVPYIPPGASQPATNATATNGSWFKMLDGSELWKALDGQPDGVELWDDTIALQLIGSNISAGDSIYTSLFSGYDTTTRIGHTVVAGERYKISFTVLASGIVQLYDSADGSPSYDTKVSSGVGRFSFVVKTDLPIVYFRLPTIGCSITDISIQRIAPQPLTLATRVMMGVGSGDIASAATDALILGCDTVGSGRLIHMYRGGVGESAVRIAQSADGTVFPYIAGVTWPRTAIVRRITQVNATGTQFRVGYAIEGTHTSVQWSAWVNFDGSFNPSTLYRLMLGYNNAYPMWFNKVAAWRKQATDAEIMEALS